MQRNWLSSYPPGVPADVEVDKFASFNALLDWIADALRPAARIQQPGRHPQLAASWSVCPASSPPTCSRSPGWAGATGSR